MLRTNGIIRTILILSVSCFCFPVFASPAGDTSRVNHIFPTFNTDSYLINQSVLHNLPFRGEAREYYNLFPGVIKQDYRGTEYLHVRGSRHDEIAYSFEGIDIRSAYTGLSLFRFIPEALSYISLSSSPAARESNAGALFHHRMRRGGDAFKITLRGETDRFTHSYEKRFDTYSYGYYNGLLLVEGKLLTDKVNFFVAGEVEFFADHYRKFWNGFTINGNEMPLIDSHTGKSLKELTGFNNIAVKPGNVPYANSDRVILNANITADLDKVCLELFGLHDYEKQRLNNTPIKDMFNPRRIPEITQSSTLLSLQANYDAPLNIKMRFQTDYVKYGKKKYDPLFGDDFVLYRDSLAIVGKGLPWDSYSGSESYIAGPRDMKFYGFDFSSPGECLTSYTKLSEEYYALSLSLFRKYGKHNCQIGGTYKKMKLRKFAINNTWGYALKIYNMGRSSINYNDIDMMELRNRGRVDMYGYDVFGNEIDQTDLVHDAPKTPSQTSCYIEDTYRSKKTRVTVGVRYDKFNSDETQLSDLFIANLDYYYIDEYNCVSNISSDAFTTTKIRSFVSPRFIAEYFVSDKVGLWCTIGRYLQQVRFRDVYESQFYFIINQIGGFSCTNPLTISAQPSSTRQSVLGMLLRYNSHIQLNASVFYRTTENLLQTDVVFAPDDVNYYLPFYVYLSNTGESIAKGFELQALLRKKGWAAFINYTYSDVKGLNSYPISNLADVTQAKRENSEIILPQELTSLEFNQTHRLNSIISYKFSQDAHFLVRNTNLSIHFRFNSGHSFDLYGGSFGHNMYYQGSLFYDDYIYGKKYSTHITTPWNYQVDLKVARTFSFGNVSFKVFLYMQNILNKKNTINVYRRTGITSSDGSFTSNLDEEYVKKYYGEEFLLLYDLINIQHRQHYQITQGGDLFGRPREIRFGVEVSFNQ